jgi:hypothetical protein
MATGAHFHTKKKIHTKKKTRPALGGTGAKDYYAST